MVLAEEQRTQHLIRYFIVTKPTMVALLQEHKALATERHLALGEFLAEWGSDKILMSRHHDAREVVGVGIPVERPLPAGWRTTKDGYAKPSRVGTKATLQSFYIPAPVEALRALFRDLQQACGGLLPPKLNGASFQYMVIDGDEPFIGQPHFEELDGTWIVTIPDKTLPYTSLGDGYEEISYAQAQLRIAQHNVNKELAQSTQ